jgi:hypothetical protein
MSYKDLTKEEKRKYHNIKHQEYRDRNREKYREIVRKSLAKFRNKKYSESDYLKKKARTEFNNKRINKKINSKECVFCKKEKTEGHHPDYSNPLFVYWMCKKCHSIFHEILKKSK